MTIALGKFTKDENDLFDIMDDWLRRDRFVLLPTFRASHSFSLPVDPPSPNSFHSTNEEFIRIVKSRSPSCSRIAPAPLEISLFRNVSKPCIVKKSGMLYFQDWISHSNKPRNRKKVGFLTTGLANYI